MKTLSPSEPCADACTAATKPAKTQQLPFPHLPARDKGTKQDFWLAAWSRETAKLEALTAFNSLQATRKSCDKNELLFLALIGGEISLKHSAYSSLEKLHDLGGLLFAFAESTKFMQGSAA